MSGNDSTTIVWEPPPIRLCSGGPYDGYPCTNSSTCEAVNDLGIVGNSIFNFQVMNSKLLTSICYDTVGICLPFPMLGQVRG